MEKKDRFKGTAKPLSLLSKIIAIIFIITTFIFYFIILKNPLTLQSASALVFVGVSLASICVSIDISMITKNIKSIRQSVTAIDDSNKDKKENEEIK